MMLNNQRNRTTDSMGAFRYLGEARNRNAASTRRRNARLQAPFFDANDEAAVEADAENEEFSSMHSPISRNSMTSWKSSRSDTTRHLSADSEPEAPRPATASLLDRFEQHSSLLARGERNPILELFINNFGEIMISLLLLKFDVSEWLWPLEENWIRVTLVSLLVVCMVVIKTKKIKLINWDEGVFHDLYVLLTTRNEEEEEEEEDNDNDGCCKHPLCRCQRDRKQKKKKPVDPTIKGVLVDVEPMDISDKILKDLASFAASNRAFLIRSKSSGDRIQVRNPSGEVIYEKLLKAEKKKSQVGEKKSSNVQKKESYKSPLDINKSNNKYERPQPKVSLQFKSRKYRPPPATTYSTEPNQSDSDYYDFPSPDESKYIQTDKIESCVGIQTEISASFYNNQTIATQTLSFGMTQTDFSDNELSTKSPEKSGRCSLGTMTSHSSLDRKLSHEFVVPDEIIYLSPSTPSKSPANEIPQQPQANPNIDAIRMARKLKFNPSTSSFTIPNKKVKQHFKSDDQTLNAIVSEVQHIPFNKEMNSSNMINESSVVGEGPLLHGTIPVNDTTNGLSNESI